jgi:hypothetical protein
MDDGWSARCVGCGQALTENYRDPDRPCPIAKRLRAWSLSPSAKHALHKTGAG